MNNTGRMPAHQGDGGFTRLGSGERVSKDDPSVEALGDLDELVSVLGLARLQVARPVTGRCLLELQRLLFRVGAELAGAPHTRPMDARCVQELERGCRKHRVPAGRGFLEPAADLAAAHLDHARAVARRLERRVVGLARCGRSQNPYLLAWLNRLSHYLWLLARAEAKFRILSQPAGKVRRRRAAGAKMP